MSDLSHLESHIFINVPSLSNIDFDQTDGRPPNEIIEIFGNGYMKECENYCQSNTEIKNYICDSSNALHNFNFPTLPCDIIVYRGVNSTNSTLNKYFSASLYPSCAIQFTRKNLQAIHLSKGTRALFVGGYTINNHLLPEFEIIVAEPMPIQKLFQQDLSIDNTVYTVDFCQI